ncbi:hypothetical protein PUN28_007542 [Cardiocondyla obscurior]|uniref:Uncharacterized protein n=1 Tax=Cardiocondyla obscurior TaxID=286306 RepID=A0AAW2G6S6_9HYME
MGNQPTPTSRKTQIKCYNKFINFLKRYFYFRKRMRKFKYVCTAIRMKNATIRYNYKCLISTKLSCILHNSTLNENFCIYKIIMRGFMKTRYSIYIISSLTSILQLIDSLKIEYATCFISSILFQSTNNLSTQCLINSRILQKTIQA